MVEPGNHPAMTFYSPPPFASNIPPPDPSLQAFNEVTQALRALVADSVFLYVAECKKLSLAVMEASEIFRTMQRRNEPVDGPTVFRQELQNQILGFALMRLLEVDDVKKAAQIANDTSMDALNQTPPMSRTGVLVREMESIASGKIDEARVQEELVAQPLFRLASQNADVLKGLDGVFDKVADSIPMLLQSTNATLAQLGAPRV